jgi:uncharacterized protein YjbJ (UPF0337 family)
MGEFVDKIKGATNEAMGKAKVAVGKGTDHPKLVATGRAQQVKGKLQSVVAKVKGKVGDRL